MSKRVYDQSVNETYRVGDKLLYYDRPCLIKEITMMTRADNTGEVVLHLRDMATGKASESVTPFTINIAAIKKEAGQ